MADLTGQTLDRYEIVELIGEGGMATVYRARQPRLNRDVALKVMLPALAADPTFRERFEREAQAIAKLRHPNILTVHDYGESADGQLYLVVEYVHGGTLRQRIEEPISLAQAVELVAQVAEALDYAHRQGVIHRDVKPNNILLTQDGRPLLADFGLARPIQGDRRLTASGMMLGTPDYVAPEQARGLALDGRADIYALGVVLFETLTGRHPYAGETPISVIIKHVSEPMPRPSELNPDVSPALDEVVARATAKSPDQRYPRAGDMARALRAALVPGATPELGSQRVTLPPGATPLPPPEPVSPVATPVPASLPVPRPWRWQTRVWVAVVLVLALAALAFVLFPALSKGEKTGSVGGMPVAQPGEVMILVARFKAQEGSEHFDVGQRIYAKLSDDLRRFGQTDVTVYPLPDVIESSEAAQAFGKKYGATLVIWGFYDDIGISPNIEAVGAVGDRPLTIGLEHFKLEAGEVADFKLYLAQDLPQELSFLTSIALVQTFMLQGELEKMLIFMDMAGENLPADPHFRSSDEMVDFVQGMLAFFQGDLEGAVERLDRAIAASPDQTLFYTMRALAFIQMGDGRAVTDLERASALEPGNELAYTLRGAVAWMMGDIEAAAQAYDQLILLEPDLAELYLVRSIIAFDMADLDSALQALSRAQEIKLTEAFVPLARGLIHEKLGQSAQALADYARALELDVSPDAAVTLMSGVAGEHVPPYAYLFQCAVYQAQGAADRQAQGKAEQALAGCDQALKIGPTYFDALWKRGQLHAAQSDWEAALADYDAAIQSDPRWPWVYYLRAQALVELGRADEAQAELDRALELNPVDELRRQIQDFDVHK
jgi:tetratricopeptide (TPR) repeat protein/tRNA A-37 threonylcarbamoyl transferase component Bud32